MRTPTLNHYFEPKIMRIIIEIIRYLTVSWPLYLYRWRVNWYPHKQSL